MTYSCAAIQPRFGSAGELDRHPRAERLGGPEPAHSTGPKVRVALAADHQAEKAYRASRPVSVLRPMDLAWADVDDRGELR